MKLLRLILGVVSIIFFLLIAFHACSIGLENTLKGTNGYVALFLSFFILLGGITGIAFRKSKSGSISTSCIYAIGGIIGVTNSGSYSDLKTWSIISIIFSMFFIGTAIIQKKDDLE